MPSSQLMAQLTGAFQNYTGTVRLKFQKVMQSITDLVGDAPSNANTLGKLYQLLLTLENSINLTETDLSLLEQFVNTIKADEDLLTTITSSKVNVSDIIDTLSSVVTNKPLSAKQGSVLKGLIDSLTTSFQTYQQSNTTALAAKVNKSDIIDNLTTDSDQAPLSARQGKVLNEQYGNMSQNLVDTSIRGVVNISTDPLNGDLIDDVVAGKTYLSMVSPTGNWTPNLVKNGGFSAWLPVGEELLLTIIANQGATPYFSDSFKIEGSAITLLWENGAVPTTGNANATDVYKYRVIRTGTNTYMVLASRSTYS